MNQIKKLLLIVAVTIGFAACNSDDVSDIALQEGNTHVSVSLSMSMNGSVPTRALPNDYNYLGEWAGKDKIVNLTVYLVDGASIASKTFTVAATGADYNLVTSTTGVQLIPQTSAAIRTTAGTKKVFVVVNPTAEVTAHLNKTPVADFERAYNEVKLIAANSGTSTTVSTSAENLAKKNGVEDEAIVMTNVAPATLVVEENILAEETIGTGAKNRASLKVERAVARVMVTTALTEYVIPTTNTSGASSLGTISDITWVLAQGENSLFVQRKTNWETPNYSWVPTSDTEYRTNAGINYDYSGLFEASTNKKGGSDVPTMTDYSENTLDKITAELNTKLAGKFILPTTHPEGAKGASSYKKGNTAYVMIRAQFTPNAASYADGSAYTSGNDFYVGENGKFYSSAANALDPSTGGVSGQKVAKYVGGKVLYYAWVNPDNVPDWYNSPVIRNNVYHIHIKGFKNLGTNWNPLYPEDPSIATPSNPDPKPVVTVPDPLNPEGPEIPVVEPKNPIDPKDPLTTLETYMSVDVTIMPWKLHSYDVELGI